MPLEDLSEDALKVAEEAATALIDHKAYLPPGGLLLMLLGRWRDDIWEVLGMEREELPRRGSERKTLAELSGIEIDTVSGAVGILLQPRFTEVMDDPALPDKLAEFQDRLTDEKTRRVKVAKVQASQAS